MRKTGYIGTLIGAKENSKQLESGHERRKSLSPSPAPEKSKLPEGITFHDAEIRGVEFSEHGQR